MAIRIRRGNQIDFDKNKLVQGELAIVLDAGELHFCYGAGNTKRLATKEDLQEMLNASETSYSAFIQLIVDLETNPNELTNILNNISALQSGKIDKSSIIQTDTTNDTTKVPSSAVTYALGQEIDTLNNNLGYQLISATLRASFTDGVSITAPLISPATYLVDIRINNRGSALYLVNTREKHCVKIASSSPSIDTIITSVVLNADKSLTVTTTIAAIGNVTCTKIG